MQDRKVKQVLSRSLGEGTVNREDEGGRIWWMYFVFMDENRAT
jgi:hypothetical protein